ncbi:hypothetical protein GCM10022279_25490 [Comamonas faecalis]|uniref:Uncharacterized protein n=1 Tax=Comamonas faecalis TaxID=1387849 RepID=A0ABP7RQ80_9BURK
MESKSFFGKCQTIPKSTLNGHFPGRPEMCGWGVLQMDGGMLKNEDTMNRHGPLTMTRSPGCGPREGGTGGVAALSVSSGARQISTKTFDPLPPVARLGPALPP